MLEKLKGYRRAISVLLTTATTLGAAYVSSNDVGVSASQVQQMSVIAGGFISGVLTVWSMFSEEPNKVRKKTEEGKYINRVD